MKTIIERMLKIPLRKVGNSFMLTIPQNIMKLVGLSEDAEFEVVVEKGILILKAQAKQ